MKKTKKVYILYGYNEFDDDFNYIMEYNTLEELKKDNNITLKNDRSIYHFIKKGLEDITHLLKDKYIIISDIIEE